MVDCDAEGENIAHEVIGITRRALELSAARRSESGDAAAAAAAQRQQSVGEARRGGTTGAGAEGNRDEGGAGAEVGEEGDGEGTQMRRVHRATFSAITPDALSAAFRALGRSDAVPDALLSRSVDARQELDLRVGVAMTRLLTWRCVGALAATLRPRPN